MAKKVLITSRFNGGAAQSGAGLPKEGIPRSFAFGRSLDFRTEPSELRILPRTVKDSSTTVADLVLWADRVSGNTYFYGNAGKIYKRTSAGAWSLLQTTSNSSGNGLKYYSEDDQLYYSIDKEIGRYGPITGSPTFDDDYFSNNTHDLDQSATASGQTYTVPTSITEDATNRQDFVPSKDPQKAVEVNISAKGSGNWTLAVHDPTNTEVASKTIANASLAASGDQKFTFGTVWRPIVGVTYHYHLTSTVGDGSVVTGTTSDLNDSDYATYFQVLVESDDHPIEQMTNALAIGNERYLAWWNGITYDPHRLRFPPGFKVRSLTRIEEFLAIGTWRGNSITEVDEGIIFFWDGYSETYNFFAQCPFGAPHAMISDKNRLMVLGSNRGELYAWGNGRFVKAKRIPKMTDQTYMTAHPGGITNFNGVTHFGVALDSDNTAIQKGVYSWGQSEKNYSEVLNYDYPISSGDYDGTDVDIGLVKAFGNELYIAWVDSGTYGVDLVDSDNSPFTSATLETLLFDDDRSHKRKRALTLVCTHEPLPANTSVTLKYKINRASSWTSSDTNDTDDSTETRLVIDKDFNEIQLAIDLVANATTPVITSLLFEFDDLSQEQVV